MAKVENLKIAAQAYNEVGSIKELEQKIAATGKEAKQTVRKLEKRIKNLAEIIKYAEQYKANKAYNIAYKKAKNPDAYFCKHENQSILYDGARRMLEQAGISLKGLNIDKLKAEYQADKNQKNFLADKTVFMYDNLQICKKIGVPKHPYSPKPSCKVRSVGL